MCLMCIFLIMSVFCSYFLMLLRFILMCDVWVLSLDGL